jgi:plastocyanin
MSGRRKIQAGAATAIAAVVVVLVLGLVSGGCGQASGVVTVKMQGLEFAPSLVSIKKGTIVRWVNEDQDVHSSTAAAWQEGKTDPLTWSSPLLNPGQTYERTFNAVGSFDYTDLMHGYMNGKITVTE